jgi:hypothetical protein
MKSNIVADGPIRFLAAQKTATTAESIRKKYTSQLAGATPEKKKRFKNKWRKNSDEAQLL